MATLTFDTYKFISRLKETGMETKQAEAIVEGLQELDLNHVATKEDIRAIKNELEKLELRMTIKTAIIVTAIISFFKIMETFF